MLTKLRMWLGVRTTKEALTDQPVIEVPTTERQVILEEPLQSILDAYMSNPKRFKINVKNTITHVNLALYISVKDKQQGLVCKIVQIQGLGVWEGTCEEVRLTVNGALMTCYKEDSLNHLIGEITKEREIRYQKVKTRKEAFLHNKLLSIYCA